MGTAAFNFDSYKRRNDPAGYRRQQQIRRNAHLDRIEKGEAPFSRGYTLESLARDRLLVRQRRARRRAALTRERQRRAREQAGLAQANNAISNPNPQSGGTGLSRAQLKSGAARRWGAGATGGAVRRAGLAQGLNAARRRR